MKGNFMKTKLCMVVLLAMALSGCVGPAAREKTLLPAIGSQWQLLRADAAGDVTGMDRAVESGLGLSGAWTAAKPLVVEGIAAQEQSGAITPLFADSKREGVRLMDEMIRKHGGDL
jgi:hypothetical protein